MAAGVPETGRETPGPRPWRTGADGRRDEPHAHPHDEKLDTSFLMGDDPSLVVCRSHSGRITTDVPNELGVRTRRGSSSYHCVTDVVGWHVAKKGDRWAALEPIRQGVRTHIDGYAPKIALGLGLRHDWGPQYTAHQFQGELAWLGIRSTASYVGEPECNGVAERHADVHVPTGRRSIERFPASDELEGGRIGG